MTRHTGACRGVTPVRGQGQRPRVPGCSRQEQPEGLPKSEVRVAAQKELPSSEVRGGSRRELPCIRGQWQEETPSEFKGSGQEELHCVQRPGVVAERCYPASGRQWWPGGDTQHQGQGQWLGGASPCVEARAAREETPRIRGQGQWP